MHSEVFIYLMVSFHFDYELLLLRFGQCVYIWVLCGSHCEHVFAIIKNVACAKEMTLT